MRNFIPALILLFNASTALAQNQPYDASASNTASRQMVVEAVNLTGNHPLRVDASAPQAPAQSVVPTGIGPSSNMPQPGDYGYSAMSDLRQLNF